MAGSEKVLVAMSGGVDSSVAAWLLQKEGYNCHGVTMQLYTENEEMPEAEQAKKIAAQLGIPFSLCDYRREFCSHVIDYFVKAYEDGKTPNPCVECNRTMKFGKLLEVADRLSCDKIATGHYARITKDANGRFLLSAAADDAKDQTYVLWSLSQAQLARTLFPLGELKKSEIRALAEEKGFCNAGQKDSQDICFIPDGDYVSFLENYTKKSYPCGDFIDLEGRLLGRHLGQHRYTIGQRKGLGIAFGKPTYVCRKNAADNTVTLGDNDALFRRDLTAHNINLIAFDSIPTPIRVLAKVRYKAAPAPATAVQTDTDCLSLLFDEPQRAISPGQSVVLYDGNTLLGGGIID